jgi:hypothetical protein
MAVRKLQLNEKMRLNVEGSGIKEGMKREIECRHLYITFLLLYLR